MGGAGASVVRVIVNASGEGRTPSVRALICCELATAHHGDVGLAEAMLVAAAEAGADYVKIQTYSREAINPTDPQAQWLRESWLDEAAHVRLQKEAIEQGVILMSTPFDAKALKLLHKLVIPAKIASSEANAGWWRNAHVVSWPWGDQGCTTYVESGVGGIMKLPRATYHLTAIPLYPTPLEAVGRATLLDGWSDHCEGISACCRAISLGAKMVEVHVTIPGARVRSWDKTADEVRALRTFAEHCVTMTSGVSRVFRERWRTA